MSKDIDFALVEKSRPPIYSAMKYWGKKPHNIWAEYIKTYTPENAGFHNYRLFLINPYVL